MLVRTGIVSDINYKNGTVKVVFPGADDYQSQELQVIHRRTKKDKSWNMPCIDEVVIVIFDGTSEGDVGYVKTELTLNMTENLNKLHYIALGI